MDGPKEKVNQDIEEFKRVVQNADVVVEVDKPTGRKNVEIAWENENGFHTREGEAYGVYRDGDNTINIDWTGCSEKSDKRTTVQKDNIVTLEEGEWKKISANQKL